MPEMVVTTMTDVKVVINNDIQFFCLNILRQFDKKTSP